LVYSWQEIADQFGIAEQVAYQGFRKPMGTVGGNLPTFGPTATRSCGTASPGEEPMPSEQSRAKGYRNHELVADLLRQPRRQSGYNPAGAIRMTADRDRRGAEPPCAAPGRQPAW
jgi:hypothetical protein